MTIARQITIENFAGHAPVIDGSDTTAPAFSIIANCTLKGLNIKGSHDLGVGSHFSENNVQVSNGATLTLTDCTLTDYNHCAVKVFSNSKLIASGNTITAGGWTTLDHGVYMSAGLAGSQITGNDISGATGWGIHAYSYEYGITISGNNIHDNHGGILVTGEDHAISGNTISNNGDGNGIDFFHYGLINLTVTNNTCSGNTLSDLRLEAGAGEGFTNCTFSGNTGTQNW